jgi:hypothetical protein
VVDTLRVELNREDLYDVATPRRFETDGDFRLRLHNHGEPTHVHVRPDDSLAAVLRPEGVNHYVESGADRDVLVRADPNRSERTSGTIEVAVGHGATRAATEISLLEPGANGVRVDESLGAPTGEERPALAGEDLQGAVFAALAVLLLAGALAAGGTAALLLGAGALLAALAALYNL